MSCQITKNEELNFINQNKCWLLGLVLLSISYQRQTSLSYFLNSKSSMKSTYYIVKWHQLTVIKCSIWELISRTLAYQLFSRAPYDERDKDHCLLVGLPPAIRNNNLLLNAGLTTWQLRQSKITIIYRLVVFIPVPVPCGDWW